jgi:Enoyl-(Acyl carrier protein) reductase
MGPAKAAMESLLRYLAWELAARGITVNAVSPGAAEDSVFSTLPAAAFEMLRDWAKEGWTPMRRLTTPADVGDAVALLCSEQAGFITGQTLTVAGGASVLCLRTIPKGNRRWRTSRPPKSSDIRVDQVFGSGPVSLRRRATASRASPTGGQLAPHERLERAGFVVMKRRRSAAAQRPRTNSVADEHHGSQRKRAERKRQKQYDEIIQHCELANGEWPRAGSSPKSHSARSSGDGPSVLLGNLREGCDGGHTGVADPPSFRLGPATATASTPSCVWQKATTARNSPTMSP